MTETQLLKLLKNQQLSEKALVEKVEAFTKEEKEELHKELVHLQDNGLVGLHDGFYFRLEDQEIFLGKVIVKTNNFVILQVIPTGEEVKINGEDANYLLIGDEVYAKEYQQNIYHCLSYYKATDTLKGRYSLTKSGKEQLLVDYLTACGKTVLISGKEEGLEINQGDLLETKIVSFNGDTLKVNVTSVLVKADEVGSDISMIISENDGRLSFPEKVTEEAKSIPQKLSEDDYKGRTDYRENLVVTIDGDDAHDFDDAVEAQRDGSGYLVRVHIADVTHYVLPNHPLDDEAQIRGTSIYVADRVVPMLPFELSNGICSLNPNEDRLVLSVTMGVDNLGHVFSSKIERGVIRSHGRLTYNKVNDYFRLEELEKELSAIQTDGPMKASQDTWDKAKAKFAEKKKEEGFLSDAAEREALTAVLEEEIAEIKARPSYSEDILEELDILHEVSLAIRRRRTLQGAMQLESTELKFHLDENGMPTSVSKQTQGEAEKMIEDLMIIANCTVAKELKKAKIPVLYRVHDFPPSDKISTLRDFLKRAGLLANFPKKENITGARLNDFLASIKDDSLRSAVSYMVLRSMSKAHYSPEEIGHFGLAELEYCHFTSPIRRYPDDIIHRLVKDYLLDKKRFDYDELYARLEAAGDELSDLEVRADHIEREVDDLESAKYMSQHIGETYHGKVMSLVQRGMFIETDLGIEGFLAYHCMHGDYFHYDEKSFAAYGRETDMSFTIGTPIDVKVLSVDVEEEEVDFATPQFYDDHALDLTEEERADLARNGVRIYTSYDDVPLMTGKPRFSRDEDEGYGERDTMNNEENDENILAAVDAMDEKEKALEDDSFRPSPEQWKEVDVIRAVKAKYPEDEEKVLQVLAVMDIDEEEYHKLLRFTKPREDKKDSRKGSYGRRSSFGGHGDRHSGHFSNRGERREARGYESRGHKSAKSFSEHRGYADYDGKKEERSSYSDRKGSYSRSDRSYGHSDRGNYSHSDRGGYSHSDRGSYSRSDRGSYSRSEDSGYPKKTFKKSGKGRSGYGKKKNTDR